MNRRVRVLPLAAATVWWILACGGVAEDDTGRRAAFVGTVEARRVVSLVPGATRLVVDLDGGAGRFVARTDAEPHAALQNLPSVGRLLAPSGEALAAVAPDLAVVHPGIDTAVVRRAVGSTARLLVLDLERLEAIVPALDTLGAVLARRERASELGARFAGEVAALRAEASTLAPIRALWVVGTTPLVAAGPGTFVDALLGLAGATNVLPEGPSPWPTVSLEVLVVRPPDVVVVPRGLPGRVEIPGDPPVIRVDDALYHVPGLHSTAAVRDLRARLAPHRPVRRRPT